MLEASRGELRLTLLPLRLASGISANNRVVVEAILWAKILD